MNWEAARGFWPNARYSRHVDVGPHRWHVQEAGRGPCLLLLHGAGASTHTWRRLLPELARDFHVVAPDLPGQGFSRPGARGRCGLAEMSADIASLLADQGISPDGIVGHSAGAAIGLRLALDLPARPRAVACINPALEDFRGPAGAVFPALAQILATTPLPAYAFSRAARFPSTVRRAIASTGSTIDATGLDLYRWLLMDAGHVDATLRMMANWKLTELVGDLPRLRVPILFVVGANDRAVPPATSFRAAGRIERAKVEILADLGHLLHEEAPDAAARVLRGFLSAHLVPAHECTDGRGAARSVAP
jgi:magnesium chelatase accessory protein